jgi:hypothetical protein
MECDSDSGRAFISGLSSWLRYYKYLSQIRLQYDSLSPVYNQTVWDMLHLAGNKGSGPQPLTPEQTQKLRELESTYNELSEKLQYHIESFYLFAKILLDRIADSTLFLWGHVCRSAGSRHTYFYNRFKDLCSRYHLAVIPEDLRQTIGNLKKRVVDYRTEFIEHPSDPNMLSGLSSSVSRISGVDVRLHHMGLDKSQTENLGCLLTALEQYMSDIVMFIGGNIEHSAIVKKNPAG